MLRKEPLRHDHWARVRRMRLAALEQVFLDNEISRWLDEGGRDQPTPTGTGPSPRRRRLAHHGRDPQTMKGGIR